MIFYVKWNDFSAKVRNTVDDVIKRRGKVKS